MEPFKRFADCPISQLYNDLFKEAMFRFRDQITIATPEKLGVGDYMVVFEPALNKLNDLLERSFMFLETAPLGELDKRRDQLFIFINQTVRAATGSPIAAQKTAADVLTVMLHPYNLKEATKIAYARESALIEGMLTDAYKAENLAHFTTLGLKEALDQLKAVQAAFRAKNEERADSRKDLLAEKTQDQRKEVFVIYGRMTDTIFAKSVLEPSADITKFMDDWNVRLKEISTTYNQSQAQKKKKTDTADESGTNTSGRPPSEAPQA